MQLIKVSSKPAIELSLRTNRPFNKRAVAERFFDLILSYGAPYRPYKYGSAEPMKKIFSEENLDDAILHWFSGFNLTPEELERDYFNGCLIMKGQPPARVQYIVFWRNYDIDINFNCITVSISKTFLKKSKEETEKFIRFSDDLVRMFSPVHSEIYDFASSLPCRLTENAIIQDDLSIRCPALKWRTYFGPPYIKMLGRDTILNAPCWKTEEVGDTIVLQMTESVFEDIPQELRQSVVDYFEKSVDPAIRAELGTGFIFRPFLATESYNKSKKLVPEFHIEEMFGKNIDVEKALYYLKPQPMKETRRKKKPQQPKD